MIVLGIDVGTTGTKTLAINENGNVVASSYREYELQTRAGGIVEQRAEDWWLAVKETVYDVSSQLNNQNEIVGISLSTQGASTVFVNSDFEPVFPVITWMDTRADPEAKVLADDIGSDYVYHCCGWTPDSSNDIAKILWLKKNHPEIFSKVYSCLTTIEYINYKLTGKNISDPTNAAIRGMYDISAAKWDSKLLSYAGIKSDMLPYVMPTGSYIGDVVSSVARELGIPNSVRVYNGAHDQYCAAIGSGALDTGDMLLSTGTTWVVLGITDKLVYTKSGISPGIYPAGGYGAMGSIISSGASLKWLRNNLVEDDYKVIDKMAAERMKDAENVFFVPFLAGAGFPDFDIDVAAGIYGLRLDNNKYDVALALMEGVAFEAKTALSEFKNSGCPIERLTMIGGASRSSLWPKITGYITECEISVMDQTEACACGAALIAAVGSGIFADYRSATSVISPKHVIDTSDTEIRDFYRKKYERYVKISDVFRTFNKI